MVTDSLREVVHELGGVLRGQQQLPLVGLGHAVALEAILCSTNRTETQSGRPRIPVNAPQSQSNSHLVSTLFLAHLAVPPQLLETFGLDSVADGLRGQKIRFSHRDHLLNQPETDVRPPKIRQQSHRTGNQPPLHPARAGVLAILDVTHSRATLSAVEKTFTSYSNHLESE